MRLLAAEPLVDAMRMKGVAAAEAPDARALEDGLEAERALEFLAHPRAFWQLLERRLVESSVAAVSACSTWRSRVICREAGASGVRSKTSMVLDGDRGELRDERRDGVEG